jgi:fatty-acyl-CoA synthase
MIDELRSRWNRVNAMVESGAFAAKVLSRTGVLGALSPRGMVAFARQARGAKIGPHLALMLHAKNKPEKIALVHGANRLTYGEFDGEINKLAHALLECGVEPGDRVAVMLPNCAEYIIAQNALPRIGAYAVQIGYRLKAKEIAYILQNAEPAALIYHVDYSDAIDGALRAADLETERIVVGAPPADDTLRGTRFEDALADHRGGEAPAVRRRGEAGGVIVYTSGTTGNPKGANRSWRQTGLEAVGDFIRRVDMNHDDRHLCVCPLYHSAAPAFVGIIYSLGGTVVVMDHFDPEAVLAVIQNERITCMFMVPTMLRRLADLPMSVRARYDFSSLRWVMSGAAPLPTETARRFQEAFGRILWNFYGATETGLVTLAGPDDHTSRPGTIGRLLRGNQIRVLDDDGNELAPGEVGELWARNSMLVTGYHRDQAATDQSMRDGFFSVGDLARIDAEGYLYLASRKTDMVISGGVNIYPREIEDHLCSHPDVVEAAVIGVPNDEWGESLKAFVVVRTGAALTAEDVVTFCRASLADYKAPRQVEFLEELPHNPTGKVLKRELRGR